MPKHYLTFEIPTTIGTTLGLSSEYIYNCKSIDLIEFKREKYKNYIDHEVFPHICYILNTCGQNILNMNNPDIEGIPKKYATPPIKISNNEFNLDIAQRKEKYYSILSFHTPLNITLNTTLPLGWFLNSKSIVQQWLNLSLIISRTPIIIYNKTNSKQIAANFQTLFNSKANLIQLNDFIRIETDNEINNKLGSWNTLLNQQIRFNNRENERQVRIIDINEELKNTIFDAMYSDGQYTGIISPQANDFYQSNNNPPDSNFNNISFLKCIFQIALLGNVFDSENIYYTSSNSIIFIRCDNNNNIKFTGKYWTKPILEKEDYVNDTEITTLQIINRIIKRIKDDPRLSGEIEHEISMENNNIFLSDIQEGDMAYNIPHERFHVYFRSTDPIDLRCKNDLFFTHKLFRSTLGLEDFLKQELALFFSGILGHSWDMLLRFFIPTNEQNVNIEFKTLKSKAPGFSVSKHYGTPIASYIYDFKNPDITNLMGTYNAINFSRVLNEKIINIRDKISTKTIYTPPDIPNCLIPIVFDNALLQCKTKCYRNFKPLLRLMKTRKQRNFLFDRLTQFGRRAMTILDPYGIFMHYHNDEKGLLPSWNENLAFENQPIIQGRQIEIENEEEENNINNIIRNDINIINTSSQQKENFNPFAEKIKSISQDIIFQEKKPIIKKHKGIKIEESSQKDDISEEQSISEKSYGRKKLDQSEYWLPKDEKREHVKPIVYNPKHYQRKKSITDSEQSEDDKMNIYTMEKKKKVQKINKFKKDRKKHQKILEENSEDEK